jgi:TetR/AcrR family tetracycline transcriptional repressor
MGRPVVPLISKREVSKEALKILDAEGVEALSVRRLAETMNVRGQSLYYHFRDKNEIVVSAIRVAFEEIHPGTPITKWRPASKFDWKEWMIDNVHNARQMYRRHPNLIPLIVRQGPLRLMTPGYEATAEILDAHGAPSHLILPILSALEAWVLGTVVIESELNKADDESWKREFPQLYDAKTSAISVDDWFDAGCRGIVESMTQTWARKPSRNAKSRQVNQNGRRGKVPKVGTVVIAQ